MDPRRRRSRRNSRRSSSSMPPASSTRRTWAPIQAEFYEGRCIQGQIAGQDVEDRTWSATSPRSRFRKSSPASMRPCSARRRVNPNIKIKIIWVNTWFDPGKEADAAKALLDQGADIIMQHTDSPGGRCRCAAQRGIYAVRPGLGHDQVRPEGAASPPSSTTGAATTRRVAKAALDGYLEGRRHLGRR